MPVSARALSIGMVLIATGMWGAAGLFVHELLAAGLSSIQVVYYANALSLLVFLTGLLIWAPRRLRVPLRALPALLPVALLSGGLTFVLYARAVELTTVSLAILLNFTAPAWVTLLAWRLLREPVTRDRLLGLAAAFGGCALLVRVYDPAAISLNLLGIGVGLGAGLSWALYQVLGKRVLESHHPLTLCVYSCAASSIALLPFQPAPFAVPIPSSAWIWMAAFIFGASVLAPILFNTALRDLPAGIVSLLALAELLVGVMLGVVVLRDPFDLPQIAGAILLCLSVFSLRQSEPIDPSAPIVSVAADHTRAPSGRIAASCPVAPPD
jgi:DME family drug/metabolite transporter